MADLKSPEQNRLLGVLANLLQGREQVQAQMGPTAMGTLLDLILPKAETVEKMSYGDPLFRMTPMSNIPITADKQYLADVAGMIPYGAPARKPAERAVRQLVQDIQTKPPVGSVKLPEKVLGLLQPQKSDLGFYSQLEAATLPLQNKGTGQQYLAQISKTPGVKPEELQWTGLEDFLKSRQSVTKPEIQDYLNANRVDVQEVRLGSGGFTPEPLVTIENIRVKPEGDAGRWFIESPTGSVLARAESEEEARQFGVRYFNSQIAERNRVGALDADNTKFSSYTLPGGENYREILLTLPAKELTEAEARVVLGAAPDAKLSAADIAYASRKNVDEYRSSHFDQPNILAHMRVNDRVVDGKKTLFIEEVQSDWHQAGRKKGYGESGVPDAPFKTTWHELALKRAIQEASEKGYDQIAFTTGKTQAERYDLSKQVNKIDVEAVEEVPNLYFVDVDFPDSRALNLEVEDGIIRGGQFSGKSLDDVVGKEMAEKILGVEPGKKQKFAGNDLTIGGEGMKGFYDNILPKSLEKLGKKFDAKVTKSKMTAGTTQNKSFADVLEKSEFKDEWFGASPERRSEIVDVLTDRMNAEQVEIWTMDITPKMRESVITKGQPLFAIPAIGTGLLGSQMQFEDQY